MSHAEMLCFHAVSFAYEKKRVLTNVSFALQAGTATALVGPNGAGKTTLLRLASGVLRPSAGVVALHGRPLQDFAAREPARLVAVVPQHLEVPFDFTVEEIVQQGRTPFLSRFGTLRPEDHRAVLTALETVGIGSLCRREFGELSGGERQGVKIAMALAQQPRLLLLDEPTQNLDIARQTQLLSLLARLRETGITILASIHDLHLIPAHFSQVLLLGTNRSARLGPTAAMLRSQPLEEAFGCERDALRWLEAINAMTAQSHLTKSL